MFGLSASIRASGIPTFWEMPQSVDVSDGHGVTVMYLGVTGVGVVLVSLVTGGGAVFGGTTGFGGVMTGSGADGGVVTGSGTGVVGSAVCTGDSVGMPDGTLYVMSGG